MGWQAAPALAKATTLPTHRACPIPEICPSGEDSPKGDYRAAHTGLST